MLYPFLFAVIRGEDDVVISESQTLGSPSIDSSRLSGKVRGSMSLKKGEIANCKLCRMGLCVCRGLVTAEDFRNRILRLWNSWLRVDRIYSTA